MSKVIVNPKENRKHSVIRFFETNYDFNVTFFSSADLSHRVDSVKDETLKLRSENQVLGQYIENLMSASSVFQSTSPKTKNK